jgi:hypothetical protein
MINPKRIGQTCIGLGLGVLPSAAQASDFSGMIYYLFAAVLIGLAIVSAVAWGITHFIPDKTIKWMVRGLALSGYLLFVFLTLFGF